MGITSGGEKSSITINMEKESFNEQVTMSTWRGYWVSSETGKNIKHFLIYGIFP